METMIFLPSRPGGACVERVVNVEPLELEAAQKKDASIAVLEEGKRHAMAGVARPWQPERATPLGGGALVEGSISPLNG